MSIADITSRGEPHCTNADPDAFFFDDARDARRRGVPDRAHQAAMRYCARCPIQQACNEAAWDGDEIGLWGGHWHTLDQDRRHKAILLLPHEQEHAA